MEIQGFSPSAVWIWALLLSLFWAVVPGLITGWMFRERGRRFLPGLILGFFCGPLGILAALAFIYVSDRRRAHGHRRGHGRAVRVFYDIPVVGRLHVSTVWALAGLATFLCLWMVGGITYEFYRSGLAPAAQDELRDAAAEIPQSKGLVEGPTPVARHASETSVNTQAQGGHSAQGRAAVLGNVSGQPEQTEQPPAGQERNAPALATLPPGEVSPVSLPPQARGAGGQLTPPTVQGVTGSAPPAGAPTRQRSDAVSEVTRDLASKGHRVHAALSGDAQTATLSISGATLTRATGNQLLGNARLRSALKAAGVRIVVMLNGEDSWTYIL
ncbi:MAG TPA: hypothetical protein VJ866_22115 [Pyrinomonadaceae bacterium]|nr:hypothetical protein [Pyrinomonadaceae bacterium]